jgi:hypothetical protein
MGWITNLFSNPDKTSNEVKVNKHTVVISETQPKRVWRNNMWVVTPEVQFIPDGAVLTSTYLL